MYQTCLFCNKPLGRNEVIESFPVGRRLAYDPARGRLWVVCGHCERWNLTPLEARWEAIDEAERQYRGTRLRASSDQIGLARLGEGLELVRIGEPLRPEMAAWRYGDQFGRRFRKHVIGSVAVAAAVTGTLIVGPVLGLISLGAFSPLLNVVNLATSARLKRRIVASAHVPGDEAPLLFRSQHLGALRLTSDRKGGFRLRVEGVRGTRGSAWQTLRDERVGRHDLTGEDAVRVAAVVLPRLNANGASRRVVQDAVGLLETARDPLETFALIAEADRRRVANSSWQTTDPGSLSAMPRAARLALEMASHENAERLALEGELAELEQAWRRAEEIAAIADDLLLPSEVRGALSRLKGRDGSA